MVNERTRTPAVAGTFYPAEAGELRRMVEGFLAEAASEDFVRERSEDRRPAALIAPHAGYPYSGPIAASAFSLLRGLDPLPKRVLLLGPSHRFPFRGIALPRAGAFETPLGTVPLDLSACEALQRLPFVAVEDRAHDREHALEVELPFLQVLLGDFELIPLVVGDARPGEVEAVLRTAVEGDRAGEGTLVVVSSDLSHYLPYGEALQADRRTAERILMGDGSLAPTDACGAGPINGLLPWASERGLEAELLDLRSSGDTAGSLDQVVGYGAFAFFPS